MSSIDAHGKLSFAIIEQAVYDYKYYLRKYKRLTNCDATRTQVRNGTLARVNSLEKFFQSDWFDTLSKLSNFNVDGMKLINAIRKTMGMQPQKMKGCNK